MKTVYLCGPITGLSYGETTNWRKYVADHVAPDIVALSPMRGKEYLAHENEIGHSYEDTIMSNARSITARDRHDCKTSDLMLANFLGAPKASIGSCIEFGWADAFSTPTVLVMEKAGNVHEHPILCDLPGWRVETLDEGIAIVNAVLSLDFARNNQ